MAAPSLRLRIRLPAGLAPPGLEEVLCRYVRVLLLRADPKAHSVVEIAPSAEPSITTESGGAPRADLEEALAFALAVWEGVLAQEVEAGGPTRELDCVCGAGREHASPRS